MGPWGSPFSPLGLSFLPGRTDRGWSRTAPRVQISCFHTAQKEGRNRGPRNPSQGRPLSSGSQIPPSVRRGGRACDALRDARDTLRDADCGLRPTTPRGTQMLCGALGKPSHPASTALLWRLGPEAGVRCEGFAPHRPGGGDRVCGLLTPASTAGSHEEKRPRVCLGSRARRWEEGALGGAWKSRLTLQPGRAGLAGVPAPPPRHPIT